MKLETEANPKARYIVTCAAIPYDFPCGQQATVTVYSIDGNTLPVRLCARCADSYRKRGWKDQP